MIRRGFADLPGRQVHFRHGGAEGAPVLLMLHGGPGSSRQLVPLMSALAATRRVLAPDLPGNGDSPPLDMPAPAIADYAAATWAFCDRMGLGPVDVYGTHAGAAVAVEMARSAPARVRRLVLDGVGYFSADEQAAHLARYALPIRPERSGAYLQTGFAFLRDLFLFWPWYEYGAAHRRPAGLPDAATMHALLVEMLKSVETYHVCYGASFAYAMGERLGLLTQETLIMAQEGDPLAPHTEAAAALVAGGRFALVARVEAAGFIGAFLRST